MHRLPDKLPWANLVAPGVVLQKGGTLQKTIAYRGPDLAASSRGELGVTALRLNNALKRLGGGWALFSEGDRRETSEYQASEFPTVASAIVDEERQRYFQAAGRHHESKYYLTFAWSLPTDLGNKLSTFFYEGGDDDDDSEVESIQRDLTFFQKKVTELVNIMRGVFPEVRELNDEETLTYLHGTISTRAHRVRVPEYPTCLDAYLPDEPLTPGDEPMLGEHFLACCTIVGFPSSTFAGVLDHLNRLGESYRWMTRFVALDKAEAKTILTRKRRHWFTKRKSLIALIKEEATKEASALVDNSAANYAADADAALQELGDDVAAYGYLTTTLVVWDRDRREALRKRARLKTAIEGCGFTVRDETLHATQAWLGSLPGHCYANVRRPIVNTLNLAHMMPISAVWCGAAYNDHLARVTGLRRPHVTCSADGTPFRLSTNVGSVGHTLIIGATETGKSTALGLLEMQWLKYPGARVVVIDKDRSARAATLANGGIYYEPGDSDVDNSAWQPLAKIDKRPERRWASRLVYMLLELQKIKLTPVVKTDVREALAAIAAMPPEMRTLTILASELGRRNPELGQAIRPYTVDGDYGQIFDGDKDDFTCATWTMIEMGHLMSMGEEVILPALEYLFRRIESQFTGEPTLLVLDEAWLFLGHPAFARRLKVWLKTLRKKNVYVVFATQEIEDATRNVELMATLLASCKVKILLPSQDLVNTPALAAAYRSVGLTEAELQLLSTATPMRDYYYRSTHGRRLFSFEMGPATLAFVGMSSPADQQFLDGMIAECDPRYYVRAILKYRGIALEQFTVGRQ
jgi:type IV secretion/conjugal transfer VirB4 family ATPase